MRASVSEKREEARPIKRILERQTRDLVGWLYEWNTGEHEPLWRKEEFEDVVFEDPEF